MKVLGLVLLLISSSALAVETGFDVGNTFTWQGFEGRVWVNCSDPAGGNGTYDCEDAYLEPADYARFVTEPGIDADRVELKATWKNGRVRIKSDAFDSTKGQSKGHFNLSIETAFQRRLLGNGLNQIHYRLLKKGALVREGDFEALVRTDAPVRVCDPGTIFETSVTSCRDVNYMCSRYFREAARNCR